MRPVDASDSSHTLEGLLSQPSAESWRAIVELGKEARKNQNPLEWGVYTEALCREVRRWPPEIERLCPASWPADFRAAVEHRVREMDTYGHYLAKICGHPDLRLNDGSQAVWLERRYTGGIVEVSTVKSALHLLTASHSASSVKTANDRVKDAVQLLAGGTRNVGKVGCADLTGGLIIPTMIAFPLPTRGAKCVDVEYRLEVEVKVGDEAQRPEQIARMESVRRRGGCYVLANSVESAVAQIKAFISAH